MSDRASQRSRKTRRKESILAPALFPFLAVMVCTIGALVFILTIAVTNAAQSAKLEVETVRQKIQDEGAFVAAATDDLLAQRDELRESIDRAREQLTHLDQHIDEIALQIEGLEQQAKIISAQSDVKTNNDQLEVESQQAKIAALKAEMSTLESIVAELEKETKTAKKAFSIIPYAGPNGTARRPIYLECTAEGVIIQPEGKLLTLQDLSPPHGPGNPLDACLRTIRRELQRSDGNSYIATPYPLLLVRPTGITSYSLARSAMAAWDDQHGYELIEADLPLAFPSSLPGMSTELDAVLAKSRTRQREIVAAMPRNYRSGLGSVDEPRDLAVEYGDESKAGSATARDLRPGERFIPVASGSQWPVVSSSGGSAGALAMPASLNSSSGSPNNTRPFEQSPKEAATSIVGGRSAIGQTASSSGSDDVGENGLQASTESYAGSNKGSAQSDQLAQAGGNPLSSSQSGAGASAPTSGPGDASEQLDAETRAELAKNGSQNQGSPSSESSSSESGRPSNSKPPNSASNSSIAKNLGQGWALQRKQLSSTPVSRTIEMRVESDRWLIVDARDPTKIETTIMLNEGPAACASQLSKAVKDRIDQWGIAVANGYWVPVIEIKPIGNSNWALAQLNAMLEDSGVIIKVRP